MGKDCSLKAEFFHLRVLFTVVYFSICRNKLQYDVLSILHYAAPIYIHVRRFSFERNCVLHQWKSETLINLK